MKPSLPFLVLSVGNLILRCFCYFLGLIIFLVPLAILSFFKY